MEPVEVLGIVFRSRGHAVWFGVGLFSIASHIVNQLCIRYVKPSLPFRYGVIPILIYAGAMVDAIVATHAGLRDSEPYTSDCIWFNALMVLIHVLLMIRFHHIRIPVRAYTDGP